MSEVVFYPGGQFAAGEHHPALTAQTFNFDVPAQADHPPAVLAAGMPFPQPEDVIELQIR